MIRGLVSEWELYFVAPSGNKWYNCPSCGAMKLIKPDSDDDIYKEKECWKCSTILVKGDN